MFLTDIYNIDYPGPSVRGKKTVEVEVTLLNSFEIVCLWRPPAPQDWGFATPPNNTIAIISRTGKAVDFKFDRYIHRVHLNKSPLKI